MEQTFMRAMTGHVTDHTHGRIDSDASGVSWGAVFGGAVVTAALSLILLALGSGLGLSAISPLSGVGISGSAIGKAAIAWLMLMQAMSGSMGGYLAGRLRTRWAGIHNDEVYFRDTAHGFLAWGLALVVTAAFLASAATVMVGAAVSQPSSSSAASADSRTTNPDAYYVDMLFRSTSPIPDAVSNDTRAEVGRVFAKAMARRKLTAEDSSYVTQLLAARTGLSPAASQARLVDVFALAQEAAESARKAMAHTLLWIFAALLVGAFSASLAATIGGRQRDNVVLV